MNIIKKKVHHRQFGDGVVTSQTTSTFMVKFSAEYGEKKFLYPSAFESFLTLENPALREKIDAELLAISEQLEAERKQREEEAEQRREEERLALLEEKRAATKSRAKARKASPKPKVKPEKAKAAKDGDGE